MPTLTAGNSVTLPIQGHETWTVASTNNTNFRAQFTPANPATSAGGGARSFGPLITSTTLGPFGVPGSLVISVDSFPVNGSVTYTYSSALFVADGSGNVTGVNTPTGTVSLGGGGGVPAITANVLLTLTTAIPPSSAYVTFGAQACNALRIKNDTGTSLEYQRNGTGNAMRIPAGTTRLIVGITNANQVGIRRTDNAITGSRIGAVAVTVEATAIVGGVSATTATPLTLSANGATYVTFASQACTALDFFNDGEFDINWRIDGGTVQRLNGGEGVVIWGITNANQISFRPVTSTGTNNFRAEALTGYTGTATLTTSTKALRIAADADIELTDVRAGWQNSAENFATLGSLRTFRPHTKPGLRRLWLADVVANVTKSGSATLTDDSTYQPLVGSTAVSVALASTATTFTHASAFTAVDCTTGSIHVTFKLPVLGGTLTNFLVEVFSGGSITANYHNASLGSLVNAFANGGSDRWMCISVGPNDWTQQGTGATLSAITNVRLSCTRSTAGDILQIGAVDYVPNSRTKGALVFSFDDSFVSQWDEIHKRFAKVGFVGCLALDPSAQTISRSGFLSLAQLREMQRQGWQIMSQSYNREREVDMTPAQWFREASKNRVLHAALGLLGGEDSSYWSATESMGPGFGERVNQFRKIYRTARRFDNGNGTLGGAGKSFNAGETFPFADPYNVRCLNMNSPTVGVGSNTVWQAHTQQAIDNKGVAVLSCHNEGANTTFQTELDTFLTWAAGQVASGTLDNVTFQQLAA